MSDNPWLPAAPPHDLDDERAPDELAAPLVTPSTTHITPSVALAAERLDTPTLLPLRAVTAEHPEPIWLIGAHGGAGATTLTQLLPIARDADRGWPILSDSTDGPRAHAVIVARTNASGLQAAQAVAGEWAAGSVPVDLLGLALIADAPGKLPKPLKQLCDIVAGGVAHTWLLPWVPAWRLGEGPQLAAAPAAYAKLASDLDAIQAAATAARGPARSSLLTPQHTAPGLIPTQPVSH